MKKEKYNGKAGSTPCAQVKIHSRLKQLKSCSKSRSVFPVLSGTPKFPLLHPRSLSSASHSSALPGGAVAVLGAAVCYWTICTRRSFPLPYQNRNRQQRVGKKWIAFLPVHGMLTYAD